MIVDSAILVRPEELTQRQWEKLFTRLTFTDAEGIEIRGYDDSARGVRIPRGAWRWLPSSLEVSDLRSCPKMPKLYCEVKLDSEGFSGQQDALQAMFRECQGVVVRQPGTGKTQIALAFIAMCKTRTLVVVHTKDLVKQWQDYARAAIPGIELGRIGGGHMKVGHLTIATVQTLKRHTNRGRKFWGQFGCVIVDETHHAAAETWEWVLNVCPAYYRFGLTATEKRSDARHPLVNMIVGPVIHRAKFKSKVPITMRPVETKFQGVYNGPFDWQNLMSQIAVDKRRNSQIAKIAVSEMQEGNTVLVLSRQINHLQNIRHEILNLTHSIKGIVMLTGQTATPRERARAIQAMRDGKVKIMLATQLADEGLDVPRLNRVLLTWPGKHEGRIIQQVGRAIRLHDDKDDAIIYDFVDETPHVLGRQFRERLRTYTELGIQKGKVVRHAQKKKRRLFSLDQVQVRRSTGA
jgi:superfamily II DNA or RNA helicase